MLQIMSSELPVDQVHFRCTPDTLQMHPCVQSIEMVMLHTV